MVADYRSPVGRRSTGPRDHSSSPGASRPPLSSRRDPRPWPRGCLAQRGTQDAAAHCASRRPPVQGPEHAPCPASACPGETWRGCEHVPKPGVAGSTPAGDISCRPQTYRLAEAAARMRALGAVLHRLARIVARGTARRSRTPMNMRLSAASPARLENRCPAFAGQRVRPQVEASGTVLAVALDPRAHPQKRPRLRSSRGLVSVPRPTLLHELRSPRWAPRPRDQGRRDQPARVAKPGPPRRTREKVRPVAKAPT